MAFQRYLVCQNISFGISPCFLRSLVPGYHRVDYPRSKRSFGPQAPVGRRAAPGPAGQREATGNRTVAQAHGPRRIFPVPFILTLP